MNRICRACNIKIDTKNYRNYRTVRIKMKIKTKLTPPSRMNILLLINNQKSKMLTLTITVKHFRFGHLFQEKLIVC